MILGITCIICIIILQYTILYLYYTHACTCILDGIMYNVYNETSSCDWSAYALHTRAYALYARDLRSLDYQAQGLGRLRCRCAPLHVACATIPSDK